MKYSASFTLCIKHHYEKIPSLHHFFPLTSKKQYSEIMKEKFNLIVGTLRGNSLLYKSNDGVLGGAGMWCSYLGSLVLTFPSGQGDLTHDTWPLGKFQSCLEVQLSVRKTKKE